MKDSGAVGMAQRFKKRMQCSKKETPEPAETEILEKTIIKLGTLLALGFGQAGTEIIAGNMKAASAGVDAMVKGERVHCIIGYARIKNFAVFTEVLQRQVMKFVNQIAEIIHGIVDEFHGAANRNNGETFLLIWNFKNLDEKEDRRKRADMAIVAFSSILGIVNRSPTLAEYRSHPFLQQRLGSKCRVGMNLGLHFGWCVEGAIGSEFKIDASYLSPHVSIASTVEMAATIYDVSLLISEAVHELASPTTARKMRLVDRVIITGSPDPMELYVMDLDVMCLKVAEKIRGSRDARGLSTARRFKARQEMEKKKVHKLREEASMSELFDTNEDICAMRKLYSQKFLHLFSMGFQNYIEGEWPVAKRMLTDTLTMLDDVEADGPSRALLDFMNKTDFVKPKDWQGCRKLEIQY